MSRESSNGARNTVAVDYLSPLPPVHSGIADYSRDLLPHLEARCDLRVLRLSGQPVDEEIVTRFKPQPAVRAGEDGRTPLYHLGNNPFHEQVFALARERPGVALLHDLNLHHLLLSRTMRYGDLDGYRKQLAADHGWVGEAVAPFVRWGRPSVAAIFALAANRSILRHQRGVLVHSRWAAAQLEEEEGLAVRWVPMGIPLPTPPSAEKVDRYRESLALGRDVALIGSFGFQTPIKRIDRVIAALARPELSKAHLLLVGEAATELDLRAMARDAGVRDRVHITGFVPFEELETAIAACDVCVNLRYPTAGETSASLLRILALGRPAVVSDYAQFRDLPDDIAIKIPLGDGEIDAIGDRVSRLLARPDVVRAMGERARAYVAREHSPERAAEAIVMALEAMRALNPPPESVPLAPTPTSLTASSLPFTVELDAGPSPWPAGARRLVHLSITNRSRVRWLPAGTGPGGIAISLRLLVDERDLRQGWPWLPLLRAIEPGETYRIELELRKGLRPGRLEVGLETLGPPQAVKRWKNSCVSLLP
ncbi:MAG TPA: glycosyltransferase family 4 protein [Thermoanaerobaculia bacterium]|nr:glycosyltransferase family 4 protein [Thermoanaerobaculia bacterium]